MSKKTILLIEDEVPQRLALANHLSLSGYTVKEAENVTEALDIVSVNTIDAVISDYSLPDYSGMEFLERLQKINPQIPVIIVTAYGTIDIAVNSMKKGAFDYLTKPINIDELLLVLSRALEHSTLVSENRRLKDQLQERAHAKNVIAASGKMEEVINLAGRVAPSKASVLICGESGTGKEVIARTIHNASKRREGPFIGFNAAALSPTLIESELFGHEKGAYTGADRAREGRFEQAEGGTLFIDEIGDIPLGLQVKFLRVLQENVVEHLGGNKQIPIDIRIIAATNKDLEKMMKQGTFREDLFYRLNVISINIPPLRERKEDILPLTDLFIKRFAAENEKTVNGFTREAFDAVMKYSFPGNVRELENMVERAVVLAREEKITLGDLPPNIFNKTNYLTDDDSAGFDQKVENLERSLIETELKKAGGNQSKAARALQITERKLRYKLEKYKIS